MSKKTALIFGGSRGIGAACVQSFVENGFDVAYTYVSNPPSDAEIASAGNVKAYKVDIRNLTEVDQYVRVLPLHSKEPRRTYFYLRLCQLSPWIFRSTQGQFPTSLFEDGHLQGCCRREQAP